MTYHNLCPRCGSQRIVAKVWEEQLGASTIKNKLMVCPDKKCQKKIDEENKKQEEKAAEMKRRAEARLQQRKAFKDAERAQRDAK